MIPIVLLFIDSFFILYALQLNDMACMESARLAASGDPRLAFVRAEQVVDGSIAHNHGPFSLQLLEARSTVDNSELAGLALYGGLVSGEIDVTTEITVRPLVLQWFLGGEKCLRFQATHELPCTYVLPSAGDPVLKQDYAQAWREFDQHSVNKRGH
jgi:hypothetical protein